jgi:hypothetical protein
MNVGRAFVAALSAGPRGTRAIAFAWPDPRSSLWRPSGSVASKYPLQDSTAPNVARLRSPMLKAPYPPAERPIRARPERLATVRRTAGDRELPGSRGPRRRRRGLRRMRPRLARARSNGCDCGLGDHERQYRNGRDSMPALHRLMPGWEIAVGRRSRPRRDRTTARRGKALPTARRTPSSHGPSPGARSRSTPSSLTLRAKA